MNTICWLAATLASLWLSLYTFNTLSNAPLGLAVLGICFFCGAMFGWSVYQDYQMIASGKDGEQ
ncbi:MAG TPA: hypothetical protein VJA25_01390 [Dehalococcoidia bacterium]|nr:hypothetical protein [Dehalococcoidia bacterium]